ncbi:DUF3598 family protein [Aphanothece sacrum]|uniref:Uncharacterized protein n=1 Tax=Aphanothece sacrum FPU1 TaxID=1920663 RepID=A0A401ILV1_APHSA|nr:DUF3598 family protein [Aphanothece sacrum]GBF82225.1 hypothetical protein AsFPU1_3653 [Aphanothece sacrum FPU1]GBF87237.1 hypothetical protein AsFPU3_4319 [Aphanothece sacrum FPU3]
MASVNLQEQHWTRLFGNVTTEPIPHYGSWTVFSLENTILRNFQGLRILQANEDLTILTHTNKFPQNDGTFQEKSWEIKKETCNLADGLLHPADPTKRSFSILEYGATSWFPQKLIPGIQFSVEFFLKYDPSNDSIGGIYGDNGVLDRIIMIREQLGDFPCEPLTPLTNISGSWQGEKLTMMPDLRILEPEIIPKLILDPSEGQNQTFFLPDQVVLTIPKMVKLGEAFQMFAGRLVTANRYQRLSVMYNELGNFVSLSNETFQC